jgi:hypothetical protein
MIFLILSLSKDADALTQAYPLVSGSKQMVLHQWDMDPATTRRHSRESGNPVDASVFWIPAFAGMTVVIERLPCKALLYSDSFWARLLEPRSPQIHMATEWRP